MRRIATLAAFALTLCVAVALGCQHTAGRCDCTANPEDAVGYTPANPYPVVTPPAGK